MNARQILCIVTLTLLTPRLFAAEKPELTQPLQRASYAIGADIAANLKSQGLELDPKALAAGLADGWTGKLALTEAERKAALDEFRSSFAAQQQAQAQATGAKNLQEGEAFLAANGKKEGVKTTASGLQYKVLKSGNGPSPKATDKVNVHYHGTLIDGTVFDSSVDRGEPISFPVNGVIAGWVEALQLMKVGDKWQLFIPSRLAYGERGAGGQIGPNSTLIFEVELLGIE